MQHWIATHHRHLKPDRHGWHIFLREQPLGVPDKDDLVVFYETEKKFNRPEWLALKPGRKGIVRIARVTGPRGPMSGIDPWICKIPCDTIRECFLPLARVLEIVGKPRFYRQNLTQISAEMFKGINRAAGVPKPERM